MGSSQNVSGIMPLALLAHGSWLLAPPASLPSASSTCPKALYETTCPLPGPAAASSSHSHPTPTTLTLALSSPGRLGELQL